MPEDAPITESVHKAGVFGEEGRTGLLAYAGLINEEPLPALSGRRAMRIYREMADNDAVIGAVLFAVEMMMRQSTWRVEAASEDSLDEDAKDFLEECMDDMEDSWSDTISEILSFLIYGFSYHEIVYKRRGGDNRDPSKNSKFDDGMTGWRKLPTRSQDSLLHWEYDLEQDQLLGMTQNVLGQTYTIPLEKAMLFRTKVIKLNPEGRSVLRNAYRAWHLKKRMEETEGIGIDRDLVGLPVLTPPESINLWDASDSNMVSLLAEANTLVQNVRQDQKMGVVKPYGWELELLQSTSRSKIDVAAAIARWDTRVAMTMLGDFVLIGHSENGTYELHRDKTSRFASAIGSWLDMVAGVFNTTAIPRLMRLNPRFTNLDEYPTIEHSAVETPDAADFGKLMEALAGGGLITPGPELEDHLREMFELPDRVEDPDAAMLVPPAPPAPPAQPPTPLQGQTQEPTVPEQDQPTPAKAPAANAVKLEVRSM